MKTRVLQIMVAAGLLFALPGLAGATTSHYSKTVSLLQAARGACYFFQLAGVTQADPSVPGGPWFAILTTDPNAKEMFAVLMTARASSMTLSRVLTSDYTVCGAAQVITIDL